MQIELSSDLLESSESKLSLIGLFAHGFSGRHVVLVDPVEKGASDAYKAWIGELSDLKLKEEIQHTLAEGDRRATEGWRKFMSSLRQESVSIASLTTTPKMRHRPPMPH